MGSKAEHRGGGGGGGGEGEEVGCERGVGGGEQKLDSRAEALSQLAASVM